MPSREGSALSSLFPAIVWVLSGIVIPLQLIDPQFILTFAVFSSMIGARWKDIGENTSFNASEDA